MDFERFSHLNRRRPLTLSNAPAIGAIGLLNPDQFSRTGADRTIDFGCSLKFLQSLNGLKIQYLVFRVRKVFAAGGNPFYLHKWNVFPLSADICHFFFFFLILAKIS